MGKFSKKKNKQIKKSRKQIRKEKRKLKKINRNEYYTKKSSKVEEETKAKTNTKKNIQNTENTFDIVLKQRKKNEQEKRKLEKAMTKQRNKQLLEANVNEDKVIRKLEKQLKFDKRKTKNISKTFASDGLDYILEMCEDDIRKDAALGERNLVNEAEDDYFEADFAVATGQKQSNSKKKSKTKNTEINDHSDDGQDNLSFDDTGFENDFSGNESHSELSDSDVISSERDEKSKRKAVKQKKKAKKDDFSDESNNELDSDALSDNLDEFNDDGSTVHPDDEENNDWEDIYGRKRDSRGNVIQESKPNKYVPPALRNQNEDSEELNRLRKQMKGQLNRLTESNLVTISQQIENLYSSGNFSRHNLNTTLCELIDSALITSAHCPKQTISDHALLIVTLHANVDIEIGANFLQYVVEKFDRLLKLENVASENKELENCVEILANLYNLKMFHCSLVHNILGSLLNDGLSERNVESMLLILKTVGPILRKDDPSALKNTLIRIQNEISRVSDTVKESSRLKFMSDILMAIKNNNFTKIANYSPNDVEHLRKVLRGAIRKNNYVTELNIALEDLLNVNERGKWWVVGSAWAGKTNLTNESNRESDEIKSEINYSQQLLELARKQRMNTDTRRSIFCILMTAEDYLDAFEKLLHLGLRGQQQREIVHVLMHCCLQEKVFNPYYAVLAKKLCEYDRKFQISIQCSVWDKLKDIKNFSSNKIANLAKFLTFLFVEGSLPLSVLKAVELNELDRPLLRLLRQTLLGVLINENLDAANRVWTRAGGNSTFKQGLRLFMHHFLLRGSILQTLSESDQELLKERAQTADKILSAKENKTIF